MAASYKCWENWLTPALMVLLQIFSRSRRFQDHYSVSVWQLHCSLIRCLRRLSKAFTHMEQPAVCGLEDASRSVVGCQLRVPMNDQNLEREWRSPASRWLPTIKGCTMCPDSQSRFINVGKRTIRTRDFTCPLRLVRCCFTKKNHVIFLTREQAHWKVNIALMSKRNRYPRKQISLFLSPSLPDRGQAAGVSDC